MDENDRTRRRFRLWQLYIGLAAVLVIASIYFWVFRQNVIMALTVVIASLQLGLRAMCDYVVEKHGNAQNPPQ